MGTVRDLHDFLEEAELLHYYSALCNQLRITAVPQLKYVEEEDLAGIGMSRPEMRRLKKMYKKECPHGALGKIKKDTLALVNTLNSKVTSKVAILTRSDGPNRTLSPSPPEQRSRPSSYIVSPGRQIIPAESIHINKSLGEGEFGVVQQGIWTTERGEKVQVALKCLSKERMENGTQEFLKEAAIMQTIDHENICAMFGVVIDKDDTLILVTELAPMRSLLECLKDSTLRLDFPLSRLCDFAQQICDGMSYLESKRLIHRDLAARNILVFSKHKVKISDFGLSRALGVGKDYYQSKYSINLKLPIAWCAPECINYLKFTSASDVWAYGVTLWEMFTYGFQPWAGLNGQEILEAIDTPNSQRLECPDLCPKDYYDLMLKCWYHDPQKRPAFSEISILLPQMRPITMKASREFPEVTVPKDYLYYKANDVVYVIDKNTSNSPAPGLWKGVLSNGKSGYFDPVNFVPFIETRASPASPASRTQLTRKESKRNSKAKLLSAAMISGPQNDLRHTGHIGYDGAVFGDVSFIGDNYDKLPVKVSSTGKLNELHRISPEKEGVSMNGHLGSGHSWISQESIDSTFALRSDENPNKNLEYTDIDDDSIFADFKMPDISSSFDFGPSFMDEVLKALNEKEAKLESPDKESTPSQEDARIDWGDSKEKKQTPPPLPSQPPRMEIKRETPKPEPRKQAKVKPMSSSDEKRMESAIAMANEFAAHSTKSHMMDAHSPPTSPISEKNIFDSENPESPKLMKKLKNSIKRSPKVEKKRTFSEEISNKTDLEGDVPPEAQEAYNMLVVKGSIKDKARSEDRSHDREFRHDRGSEWESRVKQDSYGLHRSSPARQDSINSYSSSTTQQESWRSPPETVPRQDSWNNRDSPARQDSWSTKRESPARQDSWSMKRDSPARQDGRRIQAERPSVPLANTAEVFLDSQQEEPARPTPKPRGDRSEIPVPAPKPRTEIVQRVEPVQRPQRPPPSIPKTMDYDLKVDLPEEKVNGVNKRFSTTSDHNSTASSENDDTKNQVEVLRIDIPDYNDVKKESISDTSSKDSQQEEAPKFEPTRKDSFKNDLLWSEDFSEPSPREIMSKLARESRIRRSLDHQRGALGDGLDSGPSRNIREPQGIPGKGLGAASNEDEEVDTNPLRMLRGGAIPTVRGGRVGQGTVYNVSSVPPKLRVKLPALHHSLSVDSGTNRVEHVNEGDNTSYGNDNNLNKRSLNKPPAVPPRSYSISDAGSHGNPVPLPPRKPLRQSTLNAPPRERKYPLLPNDDPGHTTSCSSNVAWSSTQNTQIKHDCDVDSSAPPPLLPRSKSVNPDMDNSEEDEDDSVFITDDDAPKLDFENHCNSFENKSKHPPPLGLMKGPTSLDLDQYSVNKLQNGSKSTNKAATFPRGKFRLQNVDCNLEQLGFYNRPDPFWDKCLVVAGRNYSDPLGSSEEISPLMLANYKSSDGVSYEDLLDFALDRKKNGPEVETLLKVFCNEVSVHDCTAALEDTGWDVLMAIKYIKLKQLLSLDLGDINHCKEALISCDWDVPRAVDYVFSQGPPSPECVDV
ncbi:activated Cdc42 kinase-like isoform X4 [Ostrea edulis]|uniref:activated Cdc42 kinase-like isoform X4 n=1 Tax=Ostrea edulis TaxID=37623 RepID=UPI0024AF1DE0|nr:activated Cdc42 kinase-like isoform X4 [Ostrea edulis]XP_056004778.1 activated Cdc42 kinase-like isoform X4 [Ostrea edulis]